jgi:hypothetical protein
VGGRKKIGRVEETRKLLGMDCRWSKGEEFEKEKKRSCDMSRRKCSTSHKQEDTPRISILGSFHDTSSGDRVNSNLYSSMGVAGLWDVSSPY